MVGTLQERLNTLHLVASEVDGKLAVQLARRVELDTLKVLNVADDIQYLDSLGRKQIAVVVRDAEIADPSANRLRAERWLREQGGMAGRGEIVYRVRDTRGDSLSR